MKRFIIHCFCVFSFLPLISARDGSAIALWQRDGKRRAERNIRIVKDRPTVYVSFDHAGKREPLRNGESENGIWLRLHNNTRWAIRLDMGDAPKEYGDAVLFYEVLSGEKVIVDMRCHVCSTNKLPPGKSILFSLPREYLDEGRAIRIGFSYEWEEDESRSTSLEPQHYVYFYSYNLPRDLK